MQIASSLKAEIVIYFLSQFVSNFTVTRLYPCHTCIISLCVYYSMDAINISMSTIIPSTKTSKL